jgi:hypothetical protein
MIELKSNDSFFHVCSVYIIRVSDIIFVCLVLKLNRANTHSLDFNNFFYACFAKVMIKLKTKKKQSKLYFFENKDIYKFSGQIIVYF